MTEDHRTTGRASGGMVFLLALLSSLGPFAIDTYLPSFPEIAAEMGATRFEVQQTLSAYLLPFAAMSLWHGAIADALGRRRVIFFALGLFALACLGCAFATRIEHLWLLRGLQGVTAGAGVVVSRAIVRDLFDGPAAQRLMAHITMMFALAPAIAPLVGGQLQAAFGWRSVFAFLALMTLALTLSVWWRLPETLPPEKRQPLRPSYLLRAYRGVLTSPRFLTACGAVAFNFLGFFIYVLSAPMFLMHHLGVSETGFLWLFGPSMSGLMTGSWISGRLAGKLAPATTVGWGYGVMGTAVATNLAINLALPPGLPWNVIPIFIYTLGMSLATPTLTLYILDPFPAQRGLAASCQTFIQATGNGLAAAFLAPALWGSTLNLALGMAGLTSLGAACAWGHSRIARQG